jgi:hypothetical protein|tara:strand:- start:142 stop:423 length:282 start_codon:yes stop_codon:yes gene_type:complete
MEKHDLKILEMLQKKYGDLVWFARTKPADMKDQKINDICRRIMKLYPVECELLWSGEGDWQHGFHSGCYAILNMMLMHEDLFDGFDDFPFLDT